MYKIIFERKAEKQLNKIRTNKKLLAKILGMVDEILVDPYSPTHKFERLKGNLSGFCSKRIDKQNRLVYKVEDDKVIRVNIHF